LGTGRVILFIFGNLAQIVRQAIPWAGAVAIVYYGVYKPIEVSAGKETTVNYAAKIATDWGLDKIGLGLAAAGGVVYGLRERKLRKDVQKLHSTQGAGAVPDDNGDAGRPS
jgi:hypothetical protein